jgi:fumarylacetoacetase
MNETHDPKRESWVESANDPASDFPIQNLPFGIFRKKGSNTRPGGGVAIGDQILDLTGVGLNTGPTLNVLAAAGRPTWKAIRKLLSDVLSDQKHRKKFSKHLVPMKKAELFLPVAIGDYSDFYTGIYHAQNAGKMFRPDNPLLPNYHWVPIGYHGRASSVVVSGTPVIRPSGQTKAPDTPAPSFGPSKRLDFELELGFVIGPGNALGKPVPIAKAQDQIFGVVLFNDWSARDIQAWEYQPLGPFLGKSFASTLSPWIVTMEALEPFRCAAFARSGDQPAPLPYLSDNADQKSGNLDIQLEAHLRTRKLPRPHCVSRSNFRHSYWTPAQIVAHQASNGCNMRPGDLLGSGTISGPTPDALGSLLEITQGGKDPVTLPNGETRGFLEDGDEVILRGRCVHEGYASIGFGECAGVIKPARGLGRASATPAPAGS